MRGWKWVGPAVAVLVLVTIVPVGRTIWTSLHRSSLTAPDDVALVGIDNYLTVLTSRTWWLAVATTLLVVVLVVITQVLLGCVFGAALNRWALAWAPARAVVLLPLALLSVVGVVLWRDAATTGFVAEWFGGADTATGSMFAISVAEVWRGTGLVVVVVAVALSRVPAPLLASAMADGATARQRWSKVIVPSIGPALAAIATFRVFDTFRALDGPLLVDRANTARPATVLLWDTQFTDFELGLGAAMSIVLLLMAVVLAAIVMPLFRVRSAL